MDLHWKANKDVDMEGLYEYYSQYNVSLDNLTEDNNDGGIRFIRLNPRFDSTETLNMLKTELPVDSSYPRLVSWLDCATSSMSWEFYAMPSKFRVAQSRAYKAGRIYGQDVSSGAAVEVLMQPSFSGCSAPERILDLCCAPGLKLCAIVDWLEQNNASGQQKKESTVVGVDVSENRLDVAKTVIHKYHIDPETSGPPVSASGPSPHIRLYLGDGTTFGTRREEDSSTHYLVFDSHVAREQQLHLGVRKRRNKSSRARERRRLRLLQDNDLGCCGKDLSAARLFDRVLVDAECSTDGSLKHVKKLLQDRRKPGARGMLSCLVNGDSLNDLVDLQKQLACTGFRLLRPGGFLVYSTCSLSKAQNEDVITQLLHDNDDAVLIPIPPDGFGKSKFVCPGTMEGTVRFLPNTGSEELDYGGGFFLARIRKTHGPISRK